MFIPFRAQAYSYFSSNDSSFNFNQFNKKYQRINTLMQKQGLKKEPDPGFKDEVLDWLFTLDHKDRLKAVTIENKWISTMISYMKAKDNSILYKYSLFESDSERPKEKENYVDNQNIALSNFFKQETRVLKKEGYTDEKKSCPDVENTLKKNIVFISLNDLNDGVLLSPFFMENKAHFNFFECITKDFLSNRYINYKTPSGKAKHGYWELSPSFELSNPHTFIEIFTGCLEQVLVMRYNMHTYDKERFEFSLVKTKLSSILDDRENLIFFLKKYYNTNETRKELFADFRNQEEINNKFFIPKEPKDGTENAIKEAVDIIRKIEVEFSSSFKKNHQFILEQKERDLIDLLIIRKEHNPQTNNYDKHYYHHFNEFARSFYEFIYNKYCGSNWNELVSQLESKDVTSKSLESSVKGKKKEKKAATKDLLKKKQGSSSNIIYSQDAKDSSTGAIIKSLESININAEQQKNNELKNKLDSNSSVLEQNSKRMLSSDNCLAYFGNLNNLTINSPIEDLLLEVKNTKAFLIKFSEDIERESNDKVKDEGFIDKLTQNELDDHITSISAPIKKEKIKAFLQNYSQKEDTVLTIKKPTPKVAEAKVAAENESIAQEIKKRNDLLTFKNPSTDAEESIKKNSLSNKNIFGDLYQTLKQNVEKNEQLSSKTSKISISEISQGVSKELTQVIKQTNDEEKKITEEEMKTKIAAVEKKTSTSPLPKNDKNNLYINKPRLSEQPQVPNLIDSLFQTINKETEVTTKSETQTTSKKKKKSKNKSTETVAKPVNENIQSTGPKISLGKSAITIDVFKNDNENDKTQKVQNSEKIISKAKTPNSMKPIDKQAHNKTNTMNSFGNVGAVSMQMPVQGLNPNNVTPINCFKNNLLGFVHNENETTAGSKKSSKKKKKKNLLGNLISNNETPPESMLINRPHIPTNNNSNFYSDYSSPTNHYANLAADISIFSNNNFEMSLNETRKLSECSNDSNHKPSNRSMMNSKRKNSGPNFIGRNAKNIKNNQTNSFKNLSNEFHNYQFTNTADFVNSELFSPNPGFNQHQAHQHQMHHPPHYHPQSYQIPPINQNYMFMKNNKINMPLSAPHQQIPFGTNFTGMYGHNPYSHHSYNPMFNINMKNGNIITPYNMPPNHPQGPIPNHPNMMMMVMNQGYYGQENPKRRSFNEEIFDHTKKDKVDDDSLGFIGDANKLTQSDKENKETREFRESREEKNKLRQGFFNKLQYDIKTYSSQRDLIFNSLKPTKIRVVQFLENLIIDTLENNVVVDVYGSFATHLSIESSDIDLAVKFNNISQRDSDYLIGKLILRIRNLNSIDCVPILTASVPVIKLSIDPLKILEKEHQEEFLKQREEFWYKNFQFDKEELNRIKVDITFIDSTGSQAKQIVEFVSREVQEHQEIKPLIHLMKRYLYLNNLNSSFNGGLSSYSLFLMILSFIKLSKFLKRTNNLHLGNLTLDMLDFFGNIVDYHSTFIDSNAFPIFFIKTPNFFDVPQIIDPIKQNHNVAKQSYEIDKVKLQFREAFLQINDLRIRCEKGEQQLLIEGSSLNFVSELLLSKLKKKE